MSALEAVAQADQEDGVPKKKRKWSKPWLLVRDQLTFSNVWDEFYEEDEERFFTSFHMKKSTFDLLLSEVEPAIYREDTRMRKAINPRHRLVATLRFLTSGGNFTLLSEIPRIAPSTLSKMVPTVCEAIYKIIGPEYIQLPTSEQEWLEKASAFEDLWDYPRCLGALDGKHCRIKAPGRSGTVFYNYKGYFRDRLTHGHAFFTVNSVFIYIFYV